ncbi:MAG: eukaryotic-like serine/threonine-protein kinase [Candidatus Sumerlaeota bacterium]|nr:eukaryotic-like serine/threonine-protein kinase [Candidatus Sumerlaeota bacterium]
MALSPEEMSNMLSRMMPEQLPEDPEESLRPAKPLGLSLPAHPDQRVSRAATKLTVFSVEKEREQESRSTDAAPLPPGPAGYGLLTLVGEGGFGEVWEAIQMSLGRIVAVKRMSDRLVKDMEDDPEELKTLEDDFQREALTTALLEHPNIVPVHDLGLDEEGRPLLAMKMVRGKRWDDLLYNDLVKLTPDEVLARHLPILIDVAQAVAFAHARGIVHRDIKPSQVMVGEFGETLLMDWGIAVLYNPDLLDDDCKQLADEIAPTPAKAFNPTGTPAYMAPEQTTKTALQIGPWTDIYLLGGILYYLLTGRSPHSAGTSAESFALAAKGIVHPPEEVAGGREIPRELAAIALKAMAKRPSDRHGTVKSFIADLENYMTGAGNRQKSMKVTQEVAAKVAKGFSSYQELTESHNLLIQAVSLWPQNPMAPPLQVKVRTTYAQMALRNGDLVLARLMAEGIEVPEAKAPLMGEIVSRERRKRWAAKQRRILYAVALVLVILIMFDVIFLVLWQKSEGMGAMKTRVQMAEQRAKTLEIEVRKLKEALSETAAEDHGAK